MSKNPPFFLIVRINTRIIPDSEGGGPAKHAFYLSKNVANGQIKMINIACKPKNSQALNRKVNPHFEVEYLPFSAPPATDISLISKLQFTLRFQFHLARTLFRIHRHRKINLIHCHTPAITGLIPFVFNLICRVPYIYTYHGLDFSNKVEQVLDHKLIHKRALFIIAISRKIKNYFVRFPISPKKLILTMPNGIDLLEYRPYHANSDREYYEIFEKLHLTGLSPQDSIVLYIGLMVSDQKVQGMVDFGVAFDQFLTSVPPEKKPTFHLFYIGDGPFKDKLEKGLAHLPHRQNIRLLGFRKEIKEFFAIAKLSALTSYIEGFPNVLLESMAAGVPCIATDVGEVKYLLSDCGFVVKPGDTKRMADALTTFFGNPNSQIEKKGKCVQRIEKNFDWAVIGKRMRQTYLKVLTIQTNNINIISTL